MNDSFDEIENKIFHKGLNRWYQSIPFLWNYYDMGTPYEVLYEKKMTRELFIQKYEKYMTVEMKELITNYDQNTEFAINCQYKNDKIWYTNKYNDDLYISFHTWLWTKSTLMDVIDSINSINKDSKVKCIYKINVGFFPIKGKMKHSFHYPFKIFEKHDNKNKKEIKIDSGMSMNKLCSRTISVHHSGGLIKYSPHDSCNFRGEEDNLMLFSIVESAYGNCITLHILRNVCDNNKLDPNNDFNTLCESQKI